MTQKVGVMIKVKTKSNRCLKDQKKNKKSKKWKKSQKKLKINGTNH